MTLSFVLLFHLFFYSLTNKLYGDFSAGAKVCIDFVQTFYGAPTIRILRTFKTLSIQRVLHWHLYMDEFDLQWKFVVEEDNVPVDCFSHLSQMSKATGENSSIKITTRRKWNGSIAENDGTLINRRWGICHWQSDWDVLRNRQWQWSNGMLPKLTTSNVLYQSIIND